MNVLSQLDLFYSQFNGHKGSIGLSHMGKPIYYFKVEFTHKPIILFQYSMHAREYVTTYLAFEQITNYINDGGEGTCYFIPAVNPDGIEIAINNNPYYKANAQGVDLNVNFDAKWGTGASNVRVKGSENFIGDYPFSEKESVALRDFTLEVKPDMTVSYHSKGEEIYFDFGQTGKDYQRDLRLAKIISGVTGYPIIEGLPSAGGYKDWCVEKLHIPAVTIEICPDQLSHPIGKEFLYTANKNFDLAKVLTENFYD